jgi:hypothetical protein
MADTTTNINDLVTSYRQNLEYDKPDEELIVAINKAIQESNEFKQQIDKVGEKNKQYWKCGTDKDYAGYHPKKSKTKVNRIFADVETAIPILTANIPEATIIGESTNDPNMNDVREKLQDGLEIAYEVKYKMQQKLQCLIRHWFLFKVGIWKYRWDAQNGFTTDNVIPKKVGIDKRATSMDDCEYFWGEMEDSTEKLIEKYPKKKADITGITGENNLKTKIRYTEFWGGNGEWVSWVIPSKNLILDKKKNPNWDYEDETKNIFKKPRIPYITLNVFNLGDDSSLYDDTSLIEESISIQDGVNQLEQQIIDLNEGQKRVWVTSGEAMSEKKAQDLVNKTGDLMVYLDRKAPLGAVTQVQSGKPDASLYNNLSHLLNEIDNIMGIHSTIRGERDVHETYGRAQLLMSSDIGRMDMIVRNVEQVVEDWYNAYLHMLKVYSNEPITWASAENTITIAPEEIPTNVMVMVKKGSTLPTDDRTRMDMAKELAAAGLIDPATLFEEMGYANIDQRFQKLVEWLQMTGKIAPQQQIQPQPGAGATGAPAGGGTPPGQPATPGGAPAGGQGGPGDHIARLQQILQSPQFQKLPDAEKQQFIQRSRQVLESIKGGGTPQ